MKKKINNLHYDKKKNKKFNDILSYHRLNKRVNFFNFLRVKKKLKKFTRLFKRWYDKISLNFLLKKKNNFAKPLKIKLIGRKFLKNNNIFLNKKNFLKNKYSYSQFKKFLHLSKSILMNLDVHEKKRKLNNFNAFQIMSDFNYKYMYLSNIDRKYNMNTFFKKKYSYYIYDRYYSLHKQLFEDKNNKSNFLLDAQWNFKSFDFQSLILKYKLNFNYKKIDVKRINIFFYFIQMCKFILKLINFLFKFIFANIIYISIITIIITIIVFFELNFYKNEISLLYVLYSIIDLFQYRFIFYEINLQNYLFYTELIAFKFFDFSSIDYTSTFVEKNSITNNIMISCNKYIIESLFYYMDRWMASFNVDIFSTMFFPYNKLFIDNQGYLLLIIDVFKEYNFVKFNTSSIYRYILTYIHYELFAEYAIFPTWLNKDSNAKYNIKDSFDNILFSMFDLLGFLCVEEYKIYKVAYQTSTPPIFRYGFYHLSSSINLISMSNIYYLHDSYKVDFLLNKLISITYIKSRFNEMFAYFNLKTFIFKLITDTYIYQFVDNEIVSRYFYYYFSFKEIFFNCYNYIKITISHYYPLINNFLISNFGDKQLCLYTIRYYLSISRYYIIYTYMWLYEYNIVPVAGEYLRYFLLLHVWDWVEYGGGYVIKCIMKFLFCDETYYNTDFIVNNYIFLQDPFGLFMNKYSKMHINSLYSDIRREIWIKAHEFIFDENLTIKLEQLQFYFFLEKIYFFHKSNSYSVPYLMSPKEFFISNYWINTFIDIINKLIIDMFRFEWFWHKNYNTVDDMIINKNSFFSDLERINYYYYILIYLLTLMCNEYFFFSYLSKFIQIFIDLINHYIVNIEVYNFLLINIKILIYYVYLNFLDFLEIREVYYYSFIHEYKYFFDLEDHFLKIIDTFNSFYKLEFELCFDWTYLFREVDAEKMYFLSKNNTFNDMFIPKTNNNMFYNVDYNFNNLFTNWSFILFNNNISVKNIFEWYNLYYNHKIHINKDISVFIYNNYSVLKYMYINIFYIDFYYSCLFGELSYLFYLDEDYKRYLLTENRYLWFYFFDKLITRFMLLIQELLYLDYFNVLPGCIDINSTLINNFRTVYTVYFILFIINGVVIFNFIWKNVYVYDIWKYLFFFYFSKDLDYRIRNVNTKFIRNTYFNKNVLVENNNNEQSKNLNDYQKEYDKYNINYLNLEECIDNESLFLKNRILSYVLDKMTFNSYKTDKLYNELLTEEALILKNENDFISRKELREKQELEDYGDIIERKFDEKGIIKRAQAFFFKKKKEKIYFSVYDKNVILENDMFEPSWWSVEAYTDNDENTYDDYTKDFFFLETRKQLSLLDKCNVYSNIVNAYYQFSTFSNSYNLYPFVPDGRIFSTFSSFFQISLPLVGKKNFFKLKLFNFLGSEKIKFFNFFFFYFMWFYNLYKYIYVNLICIYIYIICIVLLKILNCISIYHMLCINVIVLFVLFVITLFILLVKFFLKKKNYLIILLWKLNNIDILLLLLSILLLFSKSNSIQISDNNIVCNKQNNFDLIKTNVNYLKEQNISLTEIETNFAIFLKSNLLKFSNLSPITAFYCDKLFLSNVINNFFFSKNYKNINKHINEKSIVMDKDFIYFNFFKRYMSAYKTVFEYKVTCSVNNTTNKSLYENNYNLFKLDNNWWFKLYFNKNLFTTMNIFNLNKSFSKNSKLNKFKLKKNFFLKSIVYTNGLELLQFFKIKNNMHTVVLNEYKNTHEMYIIDCIDFNNKKNFIKK